MENKKIFKIDMAVIAASLFCLIFVIGYVNPQVISPVDNFETRENSILFSIEKADIILIDDNFDFTSPDEVKVEDGLVIDLSPGIYYWKAIGALESDVKKLTIISEVNLMLKKTGDVCEVVNSGNIELNVDIYNGTALVKSVNLSIDEKKEVSGIKFVGSQYE